MEKIISTLALLLTLAVLAWVAAGRFGADPALAVVLLAAGALAAGFAASVRRAAAQRRTAAPAAIAWLRLLLRLVMGIVALVCMLGGALWALSQ